MYKKFKSAEEADNWASAIWGNRLKEYQSRLLEIQREGVNCRIINALDYYSGGGNAHLNNMLRGSREHFSDAWEKINIISRLIISFVLPDNLIVYRYAKEKVLRFFASDNQLKKGSIIADPAFLSTTLLRSELRHWKKEHNCICLLKILLPKGAMQNCEKDERYRLFGQILKYEDISSRQLARISGISANII